MEFNESVVVHSHSEPSTLAVILAFNEIMSNELVKVDSRNEPLTLTAIPAFYDMESNESVAVVSACELAVFTMPYYLGL